MFGIFPKERLMFVNTLFNNVNNLIFFNVYICEFYCVYICVMDYKKLQQEHFLIKQKSLHGRYITREMIEPLLLKRNGDSQQSEVLGHSVMENPFMDLRWVMVNYVSSHGPKCMVMKAPPQRRLWISLISLILIKDTNCSMKLFFI